ncbi:MAG: hypothetical protein ACR2K1_06140, partial [Saprospiraceae bacterium]
RLLYYWWETSAPYWQFAGGIALLWLPTLVLSLSLFRANTREHFTFAGGLIKFVLLAGVLLCARAWPADTLEVWMAIARAVFA